MIKQKMKIYDRNNLLNNFNKVRQFSEKLTSPLEIEDYVVQSMPDVSPTKWHLAHTSWFFEAFVLCEYDNNYESLHPQYNYLFNSYYVKVGERHCRPKRGLISRPTVKEVYKYRGYVNEKIDEFFDNADDLNFQKYANVIEIGIHHEQQHQELMLTDIKHVLSENPLKPVYLEKTVKQLKGTLPKMNWVPLSGGLFEIGHANSDFSYDNETPKHKCYINNCLLSSRLITNKEYTEFIEDGGYNRAELWLSDGWNTREAQDWQAPLYWEKQDGKWYNFTLSGFNEAEPNLPVTHISYYEADAYSTWADARLPTENEWEIASSDLGIKGNFVENENYHPVSINGNSSKDSLLQMFGDVWEWTSSSYGPYPGYKALPGALGEYNGKFMSNQMILRGGSCATSRSHIRKTYRNFFPPDARWQFMGIRLARDE